MTPLRVEQAVTERFDVSGSAPIYAARCFGSFAVSEGVVTGFTGGNVASVTRDGTGRYTVAFTTPMPSATFVVVFMTNMKQTPFVTAVATTGFSCAFRTTTGGEAFEDPTLGGFVVFD